MLSLAFSIIFNNSSQNFSVSQNHPETLLEQSSLGPTQSSWFKRSIA